ncbi:MAG: DUF2341 domain-containing protein [Candidatus Bathyarchaeia archaeon]
MDKDGDLEIIILHQRGGIAVINTDGSVNTYKNKYRKQLSISGLPNGHDNPPIADLDGDGNLELITCSDAKHNPTQPKIFDLVEWKIDATLPYPCMHPPGLADVDGDGKWEILDCNLQNVTIFKYNSDTKKYDIIGTIPIKMAHSFFIAQDIDADGKLELVFNEHNSWISVWDVEAPAPTPLPRSGLSFYSQYRTRVPEYVSSPDQPPKISAISPNDGATNIPVSPIELKFKLLDFQNDLMNYTVTTNPNIGSASGTNVPSGTIITVPVSGLTPSTTYTWTVTVTDGKHTTTRTFTFYTKGNVTLAVNISPEGSGSVAKNPDSVNNVYAYGTRVKLTAVANNASVYRFSSWDGDLKWMGSNNPATILMDGNKTVTAKFTKIQYTLTITISPTGSGKVICNPSGPYYYGDIVKLTAVPNVGWSFSNWTGDLTGNQNPTTIIMNGNKKVTAVFTQCRYNLTITIAGKGNVTVEPYKTAYTYGENVTLTAIADSGWMFVGWGGDVSSNENPITIMMDGNKSITATFVLREGYTLTINISGNGAVNKDPNYEVYTYGENVTLIAVPDPGWKFIGWSGDITGNRNPYSIVMDGNKTVYATFIQEQYTLIVNIEGLGNVTKTPDQSAYIYGTQVQLKASADAGWIFSHWSGDIESVDNPVTFEITGNMTIIAHFALKHFTINASVEGVGGTLEPSGVIIVAYGENITFTIEPNVGYHILKVLVDGEDIGPISQYTFYSVNMNHSITAFFAPNKYMLAVNVSPEGSGSVTLNNTGPYCYGDAVLLIAEPNDGWIFSHWSGDASGTNNSITIIIDGNKSLTAVFVETQAWWNTAWKYRRVITINHTKVSGDLIDFPLLIEIIDSSLIGKVQSDGDDFVFVDANNTKLDHQIEFYNNSEGHLIAWVRIPYLSSKTNTTIYVYYGNPYCENQQNPTAVWNANYKLVLHLNEKTGTHYDSTINGNNGTPLNGVLQGITGKIDGADTFDGANDYIRIPHSDSLSGYTEALTISFWIKFGDTSRRQTILCKYNTNGNMRGWQIEYDPTWQRPFWLFASENGVTYSEWWASWEAFKPEANTWYHLTVVWEANAIPKFYVNGIQVPTVGTGKISSIFNNIGVPLYIGRSVYSTRFFKGSLDEITILNRALPAEWIFTTYNNQLNPSTFYTIGPEEQYAGNNPTGASEYFDSFSSSIQAERIELNINDILDI